MIIIPTKELERLALIEIRKTTGLDRKEFAVKIKSDYYHVQKMETGLRGVSPDYLDHILISIPMSQKTYIQILQKILDQHDHSPSIN